MFDTDGRKVQVTSPVPGYGQSIPETMLLGHIAWWTVTNPRLTHDDVLTLVTDLGMDPAIVPKPPRGGDAFKRACRYSERRGLSIPYSDHQANFLIRSVAQTHEDIERHLVLEVVDGDGRQLDYHIAAHLRYERSTGTLHVGQKKISSDLDPMVDETLQLFAAKLEDATKYIDAQVIRRMIRDQLDMLHAISVRSGGSVYFIPWREHKTTEALEIFLTNCGDGSAFHSLPLIDDSKQREMIQAAFENEVHEEATQLITELRQSKLQEKEMTSTAWAIYRDKLNDLQARRSEYTDIVDFELLKAEAEVKALETALTDYLTSGLIKT